MTNILKVLVNISIKGGFICAWGKMKRGKQRKNDRSEVVPN
jgi:hypothetical protein